jgi:hypothetical protein
MNDFNIQYLFNSLQDVIDAFVSVFTMLGDSISDIVDFVADNAGVVTLIQMGFDSIHPIIIVLFVLFVTFVFVFVVIRKGLT